MENSLRYWPLIILFLFSIPDPSHAGDSTRTRHSLKAILSRDGRTIGQDAVGLVRAPGRFGSDQWLTMGLILGGTAALFPADEPVRDFAARQHGRTQNDAADFVNQNLSRVEIGPAVWLAGLVLRNESVRTAGLEMAEALVFSGAVTHTLKTVIGRGRPYLDQGAYSYRPFSISVDWASLPSGHTTAAFSMYSALAAHLHNTWASIGLYGLATTAGLARIYADDHWASDVLLGAAIGTVIGNAVVKMHEQRNPNARWEVSLAPGGARVAVKF